MNKHSRIGKATPFSEQEYYPMSMSNGRDCVLINFGGSNFLSLNTHQRLEWHQGAPCGWYKCANMVKGEVLQPIVMAGVQLEVDGVMAQPIFYEQEFIAEKATLVTTTQFRYGIRLRIESFFTDDSVWCEKTELLESPDEANVRLAFRLNAPIIGDQCSVFRAPWDLVFAESGNNAFSFTYKSAKFTGKGLLVADKPFDKTEYTKEDVSLDGRSLYAEGSYLNVRAGFCVCRNMICLGDQESYVDFDTLAKKANDSYENLKTIHQTVWKEYFNRSEIHLPNEDLKALYQLSRYLMRAYQHPETGLIALGMQPNHWYGACTCAWDAQYAHDALLTSGNFKESTHYVRSFERLAPESYAAIKKHGFPGVSFAGWTTLLGEFKGWRPLDDWLMNYKPHFSAYAIHSAYHEWKTNPTFDKSKVETLLKDVLAFWLAKLIEEKDGICYIVDVKDASETGLNASVDTWITIDFAKAFHYVAEMYEDEGYKVIGDKLLKSLSGNYREGRLLSAKGAKYESGVTIWTYPYSYTERLMTDEKVREAMEKGKTPWGYDNDVPSEEYRHWSWSNSNLARCFIRMRKPEKAMENILRLMYNVSSLGAMPEKTRIDGFKENYFYATPHGLAVLTINEGFALAENDRILLGYGFANTLENLECRDIRVFGQCSVSLKIENGAFTYVKICNESGQEKRLVLDFNPSFESPSLGEVEIDANGTFVWEK